MPVDEEQTRNGVTGACGWLGVAHSANLTPMTDIDSPTVPAPGLGDLATRMGIVLVSATADTVVATMPVAGNTQPFGLLHGGASITLAETAASVAASLHAGEGRMAVGIEVNASHHRSATSGTVTATASAIHRGRSIAVYEVTVVDDDGQRLCTARVTCMVVTVRPEVAAEVPSTRRATEAPEPASA